MAELIGLSDQSLNLLFTLFFLGLLIQCLLLYFTLAGIRKQNGYMVFEALLLIFLAWMSWYIGTLKDDLFNGLLLLSRPDLRPALFPVVLFGFWLAVHARRPRFGLCALMLLCVTPVLDGIDGTLGLRLSVSGAVMILLSLTELSKRVADFRRNITGLSVKEALDRLPDGLLFAGPGGQPVSVNRRAVETVGSLGLSCYDRIEVLWDKLSRHPSRVEETDVTDGLLIRGKEGACFSFMKYPIDIRNRRFTQLYLRAVTKEYSVAQQVRDENRRLEANAQELKQLLELAEENARRKEILDSRARLHDILSQRLSLTRVLLVGLEKAPDEKQLGEIRGLLMSIGQDLFYEPEPAPQLRLEQLVRIYKTIGTDITCEGRLPVSDEISDLFVKILREAFSNALRHAGATRILVCFDESAEGYSMTVSNDGYCPAESLKEGNGIQSMRARLEPFDGKMTVETDNEFMIRVYIAKGL